MIALYNGYSTKVALIDENIAHHKIAVWMHIGEKDNTDLLDLNDAA